MVAEPRLNLAGRNLKNVTFGQFSFGILLPVITPKKQATFYRTGNFYMFGQPKKLTITRHRSVENECKFVRPYQTNVSICFGL